MGVGPGVGVKVLVGVADGGGGVLGISVPVGVSVGVGVRVGLGVKVGVGLKVGVASLTGVLVGMDVDRAGVNGLGEDRFVSCLPILRPIPAPLTTTKPMPSCKPTTITSRGITNQ